MENETEAGSSLSERKDRRMDGNYFWKRAEVIEIDLIDLLRSLFMQWKRIAVCAAVFALVIGGYVWLKDREIPENIAKETVLTETEEQAVADAAGLETEIRSLEVYLENSPLMQIDSYHKNKFVMLYCIDNAKRQELPVITESYLNFVVNGGAADAVKNIDSSWKTDKSYLSELMSAYQKTYNSPYQVIVDGQEDSSQMTETLFYVEIAGRTEDEAEKLAADMENALDRYSADVKKISGKHRLRLVSSQASVTVDSGLQSQQREKKVLLSSNRSNLKAITDAFSEEQMEVYQSVVYGEEQNVHKGMGETESDGTIMDESISDNSFAFVIKYIILGAGVGVFIYCCIFSCWYIFRDTIKRTNELRTLYKFPVYGEIELENKNRKKSSTVTGLRRDAYGGTEVQMMNRLRLSCKRREMKKLFAASDFPLDTKEKECLKRIAEQLKCCGINMKTAECASADTALWDELEETKNVLMICRIGTTTHQMIEDAMNFYLENSITVIGAAVFIQNE